MFENLAGIVGYLIDEDRLVRAQKNARIAEAMMTRKSERIGTWGRTRRQIVRGR